MVNNMSEQAETNDISGGERRPKPQATGKRCVFIVGSLLVGLGLAVTLSELVLIIVNPFHLRIRGHKIKLERNVTRVIENPGIPGLDSIIQQTRNSLGFRGPDPPHLFDDHITILTVGGSTTECYYLSDTMTWSARLSAKLQGHVDRLWLNNAGLDGHSTFGHYALAHQYFAEMEVDFVLLLVGANDVGRTDVNPYDRLLFKGLDDYKQLSRVRRAIITLAEYSKLMAVVDAMCRHFAARDRGLVHGSLEHRGLDMARVPTIDTAGEDQTVLEKHRVEYVDSYRHRLTSLVEIIRSHQITPILVTQPALYGDAVDETTGTDLGTMDMGGISGSLNWRILELYNDVTRATASKLAIDLIDLAEVMPKDSRFYYDLIHFNNDGAEMVADLMATEMCLIIEKRFPTHMRTTCSDWSN